MLEFLRDFRYAGRSLRKTPTAACAAIFALAIGIGVNVSSFIGVNSLILHPFPFPRLDRIVTISETTPQAGSELASLAPANYLDLARSAKSFERLAAYRIEDGVLAGSAAPVPVRVCRATPAFFPVLGIRPAIGELPAPDSDTATPARVAVVSDAFWKGHLGAATEPFDPASAKQALLIDGHRYDVIGVMPDEFDFPLGTEVWLPLSLESPVANDRGRHNLGVIGLLKGGTASSAATRSAQDEASAIAARLANQYPFTNKGRSLRLVPLRDGTDAVTSRFLEILLCAASFVLILACANVANLQLARAANRRREIVVRAAMGAGQLQIARGLLAESLWIAILACPVGVALASWNLDRGRISISPYAMRIVPGLRTMHLDYRVVLYSFGLSLVAGIVCSLPAILQLLRHSKASDWGDALRERAGSTHFRIHGMRSALIVGELALSLVLLVGAGLMVDTFNRLLHVDQGFDARSVLTWHHALPAERYAEPSAQVNFYDRLLTSLSAVPGIASASLEASLGAPDQFRLEGRPEPSSGEEQPDVKAVSPHFFDTLRIPIRRGRSITEMDRPDSQRVVVLSEGLARHYWGDRDPLNQRIQLDKTSGWWTVVGIAGDVKDDWFNGTASPQAYISYAQHPSSSTRFLVRTLTAPTSVSSAMESRISELDKNLPVLEMRSYEEALAEERGGVEAAASAMSTYAIAALLLAITGVYAVISFFVAARTHDIGVRIALGATTLHVMRLTLTQTARLLVVGLAIGIPLSWGMAYAASAALYGVVQFGPASVLAFAGGLALAALLASYLPSRRAAHIDPIAALRSE